MRSRPPRSGSGAVTLPTTAARTSHLRHTSATAAQDSGVTMASMRSWLSLVITSHASMPSSRRGTAETSTSIPTPPRPAVSLVAQAKPAPPRSWIPTTSLRSRSSRHASINRFSSKGSPTWTLGRLVSSAAPPPPPSSPAKPAEARTETPPIPSRPVEFPSNTARLPGPDAMPSTRRSVGRAPRQSTLTSGFCA